MNVGNRTPQQYKFYVYDMDELKWGYALSLENLQSEGIKSKAKMKKLLQYPFFTVFDIFLFSKVHVRFELIACEIWALYSFRKMNVR